MESAGVIFGLRWLDIATIAAILLGPIFAVIVTRIQDNRREERDRRVEILRSLLRTRQIRLSPDHVAALNLIELEFYGRGKVIDAHREYIKHLSSPMPMPDEQDRYFEVRHDLFVSLLHEIAKELGYSFDKHDLARFAYAPTGWEKDETRLRTNAALLTEILEGRRALPVTPMTPPPQNPFPPAPIVNSRQSDPIGE